MDELEREEDEDLQEVDEGDIGTWVFDTPRYEKPPVRIAFGETVWCPTCKGRTKVKIKGKVVDCQRCNATGVIPNEGPVAPIRKP